MNQGTISGIVQPQYYLYERCEGANNWQVNAGSPNFNYKAAILEGKNAYYLTSSNDISKRITVRGAPSGSTPSASCHFQIRFPAISSAGDIAGFADTTNTTFNGYMNIQSNGTVRIVDGASFGVTTAAMSTNTNYHVWIERRLGVNKLWFSTSSIRPASQSANFAQVNGSSTTLAGEFWATANGQAFIIDDIQVQQI